MSLRNSIKTRIKSLNCYKYIHVARRAGLRHLWQRERIVRWINTASPVATRSRTAEAAQNSSSAEVHLLVRASDVLPAIWALTSFYRAANVDWPVIVHQGGTMRQRDWDKLRHHFPNATLLPTAEGDVEVETQLRHRGLTNTLAVRRKAPMLRKLVDPILTSAATSFLILDSDVLFFQRPNELLNLAGRIDHPNCYNRDRVANAYNIGDDQAKERFGMAPIAHLNAGLSLVRRETFSPNWIEECLADPIVTQTPFFVEQTLHALLAGEIGCVFLPPTYACSTLPGLVTSDNQPLVAKHYIETPRPLLYEEGMVHLEANGITRPKF